eukprot:gene23520-biopygen10355
MHHTQLGASGVPHLGEAWVTARVLDPGGVGVRLHDYRIWGVGGQAARREWPGGVVLQFAPPRVRAPGAQMIRLASGENKDVHLYTECMVRKSGEAQGFVHVLAVLPPDVPLDRR